MSNQYAEAMEDAHLLSETKSGHLYLMLLNPIISLVGTTSGIICHSEYFLDTKQRWYPIKVHIWNYYTPTILKLSMNNKGGKDSYNVVY